MNKAIPTRNLRVGDVAGKFTLVSKSEYKKDTRGYITTWSTPTGLQVLFLALDDFIGVGHFARV